MVCALDLLRKGLSDPRSIDGAGGESSALAIAYHNLAVEQEALGLYQEALDSYVNRLFRCVNRLFIHVPRGARLVRSMGCLEVLNVVVFLRRLKACGR